MNSEAGNQRRPFRVAIVGSGPSGFYAAEPLLTANRNVEVDMYDRLPTPFGLVRYGVAPDHPKIKNVIRVYEKTAADPKLAFFGNVAVGRDIRVAELRRFYDAVIFACGAETDRHLNIPNEDFKGSHTATEFVGWYNGHPDYQGRSFDLSHPVAVVIGLGNVAMDVARVLCKTVDELKNTDITRRALEVLAESNVREVHVVGRRGPAQAAFTPVEIREFGELHDCDPVVAANDLILNPASQVELDDPQAPVRRKNFEILQKYAAWPSSAKRKKFVLHFLKSPVEIKGGGRVEKLVLEKNELTGEPGRQNARGTGQFEELDCGLVFRSVGYQGLPIDDLPFDAKKGVFPNQGGRLTRDGEIVPGLYATGWIKRGPSGVIGTNKPDSQETVTNLLADASQLKPCEQPDRTAVMEFLSRKNIRFIRFEDWKKIDAAEIKRGEPLGKPREKFTTVAEMMACLDMREAGRVKREA